MDGQGSGAYFPAPDEAATGASMNAAVQALKQKGAGKIIVALPVAASDSLESLSKEVDETVCLYTPKIFMAVGDFYLEFGQTSDDEVIKIFNSV